MYNITLANAHACKVIRNTHKEWSKNTALQKEAENKDRILLLVKELLFWDKLYHAVPTF